MLLGSFSAAAQATGSAMSAFGQTRLPPRAAFVLWATHLGQVFGASRRLGFQWLGRMWHFVDKNNFALAISAIVLFGALLRIYALDYQSLWTDEIFSLMTTDPTHTFGDFWNRILSDTHPPIYYLILRLSSTVFGQSGMAARAPSAFFGVLTLCVAAVLTGSSLLRSSRLAFSCRT
jgi:hypothetical protein